MYIYIYIYICIYIYILCIYMSLIYIQASKNHLLSVNSRKPHIGVTDSTSTKV